MQLTRYNTPTAWINNNMVTAWALWTLLRFQIRPQMLRVTGIQVSHLSRVTWLHRHHRASKQTRVSNLHVQTTAQTQEWVQEHLTSSLQWQSLGGVSNYEDEISQGSNTQQRRCMENVWLSQTMPNTESQNQITVFHPHKIQKQILQC